MSDEYIRPPHINYVRGKVANDHLSLADDPEIAAIYRENARRARRRKPKIRGGWSTAHRGIGGSTCPFCKELIAFKEDPKHLEHCDKRPEEMRERSAAPAVHIFTPHYDPSLDKWFETRTEKIAYMKANGIVEMG